MMGLAMVPQQPQQRNVGSNRFWDSRIWDIATRLLVPAALFAGGWLVNQATILTDHENRLRGIERIAERNAITLEKLSDTMAAIQVNLGRLEERLAALVRK